MGGGFEEHFESTNDGVKATAVPLESFGLGSGLVGGNAASLSMNNWAMLCEVLGDRDHALGGIFFGFGRVKVKEFPQGAIDEITEV